METIFNKTSEGELLKNDREEAWQTNSFWLGILLLITTICGAIEWAALHDAMLSEHKVPTTILIAVTVVAFSIVFFIHNRKYRRVNRLYKRYKARQKE